MAEERGERGVAGERGPKGDHGQSGTKGDRGAIGFFGYLIAIAGAIALSVMICTAALRDNLVDSCIRSGPVAALSAKFALDAAEARQRDGNIATANDYRAEAQGFIDSIAVPNDMRTGDPGLAEIRAVNGTDGIPIRYVLTDKAADLQRKGCEDAFPRPIPFID